MDYTAKDKRLFLRLGDRVTHLQHEEWGEGAVVEERTSIVPGGTCLVRLLFEDGQQRTFNNDLDHPQCCSVFGIRRILAVALDEILPEPVRGSSSRPRLPAPGSAGRTKVRPRRRAGAG